MQSAFAEYYCADNGCPNVPNRTNGWDDAVEEHLQPERRGCCDKEKIYSLHEPATECISKGKVCYLKTKPICLPISDSRDGCEIEVWQAEHCNLWE